MSRITISQIRKLHDQYVHDRELFRGAKGIIAPIRAVLFTDTRELSKFLLEYAWVSNTGKQEFWRKKSSHIGYLAAYNDLAHHQVLTAWSLCAPRDLRAGDFDKEYGVHTAIKRLFSGNSRYSASEIWKEPNAVSRLSISVAPIMFFDEWTIESQAKDFVERCAKYYRTSEIQ